MAKDPYKYFRVEAAELLDNLTRGVQELEKGAPDPSMIAGLLRLAHTLKGASQVVKQPGIAQVAHSVEDLLGPYRERTAPVPPGQTRAVMSLLDQIAAQLTDLDAPPRGPAGSAAPRPAEPVETVRVDVEEMDDLLASLAEAGADLAAVQHETETLGRARQLAGWLAQQIHAGASGSSSDAAIKIHSIADELAGTLASSERRLTAGVERAERELGQVCERANRLRLLPVQAIVPLLARAAREAASALGKHVEFGTAGGDIRLDAQVLAVLRDALLHLVRNAVAHGIEEEPLRVSAGKPPAGRVTVQVRRDGARLIVLCRDDGRGMDLAAIRRAAVEKGAISEAEAASLGLPEAIDLILKGGLSTSPVTRISGRGIGLDAVRDAVARLKGEIQVDTAPGQGTTVQISVPVSLTSAAVLLVETAGVEAAIPLEAVRQTLSLSEAQIACVGTGESIACDGSAVPFLRLSEVLGGGTSAQRGESRMAVVVGSAAAAAAVGVQRLLGTSTILVRPLPALAAVEPAVAGAALDAEGSPLLVLSPERLIDAARRVRAAAGASPGTPRPPILIVDDSLTTRIVEQSVLESAGHRVECATSAEEALDKARQGRYSLFLVDIEMPGMDGFAFIDRARGDPLLRDTPCILVTSRGSAEDRQRGLDVGARAYIVKNEFDQSRFLETVRQLVE